MNIRPRNVRWLGVFTMALAVSTFSVALLPTTAQAQVVQQKRQSWPFENGAITFTNAFPGARLNKVTAGDTAGAYTLLIQREGKNVSNMSTWYAFAIESKAPRTLELTLSYAPGRHRYPPKIRFGETGEWIAIPDSKVKQGKEKFETIVTVEVGAGRTYIAGEPMLTVADQMAWADALVKQNAFVTRREIGKSVAGVPLIALETRTAKAADARTIIVMTWQHPPEVSGVRSFRAFIETVLGDSTEAKALREKFNFTIIPVSNPDGVNEGAWRHNLGDVDLNRDWEKFSQPESRALRDVFTKVIRPGLFLDFHSTQKTVFYTHPDEITGPPQGFTAAWITALQNRFPNDKFKRDTGHNPTADTSRNWAAMKLGITAITVELADEVSLQWSKDFGHAAAEEMMAFLLKSGAAGAAAGGDTAKAK